MEGENLHLRASENSFFRILSEALTMNYLPTRLEVDLPGKEGERQFLGFTLAELKDGGKKTGVCAFFKDLTHVEIGTNVLAGNARSGILEAYRKSLAKRGNSMVPPLWDGMASDRIWAILLSG